MIAREASLAPGLVHYHFTNKQEILVALVEQIPGGGDADGVGFPAHGGCLAPVSAS